MFGFICILLVRFVIWFYLIISGLRKKFCYEGGELEIFGRIVLMGIFGGRVFFVFSVLVFV